MHNFPTKYDNKFNSPHFPAAVLYDGVWWWAIDEPKEDLFLCVRHVGADTEEIKLHRDEMEEFI